MTWNDVLTNLFDDPNLPLLLVSSLLPLEGHGVGPWEALGASWGLEGLWGLWGLVGLGGHSLTGGRSVVELLPRLRSGDSAHRQSRDTWCLVTQPNQTLEGNSIFLIIIITRPGQVTSPHDMGQQKHFREPASKNITLKHHALHFPIQPHIQPMNCLPCSF